MFIFRTEPVITLRLRISNIKPAYIPRVLQVVLNDGIMKISIFLQSFVFDRCSTQSKSLFCRDQLLFTSLTGKRPSDQNHQH